MNTAEPAPRAPRAAIALYLVGAFFAPLVGDLGFHILGLAPATGGFIFVAGCIVLGEFLRRKHPTAVLRRAKHQPLTRGGEYLIAAFYVALGVGLLVSLPAGEPIMRTGAGLGASLVLSGLLIAIGPALALVSARERRRKPASAPMCLGSDEVNCADPG